MSFFIPYIKPYIFVLSIFFSFGQPVQIAFAKDQHLTVAIEEFPEHFNPVLLSGSFVFTLGAQLFAGLTRLDSSGNAIPYLAKKWEMSEDGLSYTFFLHENAFFHDGTPIKPSDIIFSVRTSQKHHPFHPFLENIETVSAVNAHTLVFHLRKSMPTLPTLLLPILVPILPEHVYGGDTNLAKTTANIDVIGSGPFMLDSYKKNVSIRLLKHPQFFLSGKPYLESLTYTIRMDYSETIYGLSVDDVDLVSMFLWGQVKHFFDSYPNTLNIQKSSNISPYLIVTYNMQKKPFSEKKVRQAFSLAINRVTLAQLIKDDNVQAMHGPFPHEAPFFVSREGEYNVKKANALLDEAGYPRNEHGKRFEITLDYQNYPFNIEILRWLQNEFSSLLGIEIRTRQASSLGESMENVGAGDFDMFLDELFAWHDPLVGVHRSYSNTNHEKGRIWTNVGKYANAEVEQLMEEASTEMDPEKRQLLYTQLQKTLAEDYAALWLVTNSYYLISNAHIRNLETLAFGIMSPFIEVYKSHEK